MKTRSILMMLLLAATGGSAAGQELIGGWEGGPGNGYGFLMPVISLPSQGPASFIIRPSIGYLYYDYRQAGGFTNVTAPELSLGIGYRLRTKKATLTIGPGIQEEWQHKMQADGSSTYTKLHGVMGQGDLYYSATRFTAMTLNGSYQEANHYLWSRAGLKRQITGRKSEGGSPLSLGGEVTAQGNGDVHQLQAGALFELGLSRSHSSLQFHAGYARLQFLDGSQEIRPYFGAGFYKSF